jgi:hypothetical protein
VRTLVYQREKKKKKEEEKEILDYLKKSLVSSGPCCMKTLFIFIFFFQKKLQTTTFFKLLLTKKKKKKKKKKEEEEIEKKGSCQFPAPSLLDSQARLSTNFGCCACSRACSCCWCGIWVRCCGWDCSAFEGPLTKNYITQLHLHHAASKKSRQEKRRWGSFRYLAITECCSDDPGHFLRRSSGRLIARDRSPRGDPARA